MDRYCGFRAGEPCAVYLPGAMRGRCRTSDLPLCRDMEHDVMQGSMGKREHPPKKAHLDRFSHFCTAHPCAQQTDCPTVLFVM